MRAGTEMEEVKEEEASGREVEWINKTGIERKKENMKGID